MKMKINTIISWLMKVVIIWLLLVFLYKKDYPLALSAFISIIVFLMPAVIERNYKINLPWIFDILIITPLFIHILGITYKWYNNLYFSSFSHFIGTIIIALLGFMIPFTLNATGKIKLSIKMIMFFTIIFSIAIGAVWEIAEFSSDVFLETKSQPSNTDTMLDLLFDALSGVVTAFIGAWYIKKIPPHRLNNIIDPFATMMKIEYKK
ncbi:MAG: hypothetical protein AB1571_00670 [Nanoarchaeota archaeon]